jgi:membrane dipeptidase
MRLEWTSLAVVRDLPQNGAPVELEGMAFAPDAMPPGYALLLPEAACCRGCRPDPAVAVEAIFAGAAPAGPGPHRIAGTWHALPPGDPTGWRWQIRDARAVAAALPGGPWLRRRALLGAVPLLCAAVTACAEPALPSPASRALVAGATPMDLHSHAGRVILPRGRLRPFEPVAAPMREGGMRLVALAMVTDSPILTVTPDNRIEAFREPQPDELYAHSVAAFARLQELSTAPASRPHQIRLP